jgi:hypothetical protein
LSVTIFFGSSPWRFNNQKKRLAGAPSLFYLKVDIDNFAALIHSSPKVLPLPIDPYKNFVNVERIIIVPVILSQSACVNSAKFDAPELDSLTTYNDPALVQ